MYVRIVDEWSFTDNSDDRPELVASAASANLGPLVDRYIPCGNWQLGSDKRAKVRCSGTRVRSWGALRPKLRETGGAEVAVEGKCLRDA
jgi:hypothetical protein